MMSNATDNQSPIYEHPELCDVIFASRDIESEAAFVQQLISRFSDIPVRRILEICCGTAPHAGAFQQLGYQYVGLDISQSMVTYCRRRWRGGKLQPRFLRGDLRGFRLKDKVDFACVMVGSLYTESLDELSKHFDSVSRTLRPGGLYFLDSCVQFANPVMGASDRIVYHRRGATEVRSAYTIRPIDIAAQCYEEQWRFEISDGDAPFSLAACERNKAIFPQEFRLFVDTRPDFAFVGWWADWHLDLPITGQTDITRPVVVLRRI